MKPVRKITQEKNYVGLAYFPGRYHRGTHLTQLVWQWL